MLVWVESISITAPCDSCTVEVELLTDGARHSSDHTTIGVEPTWHGSFAEVTRTAGCGL